MNWAMLTIRGRGRLLTLTIVGAALLAPSPAMATDDEVRQVVTDSSARIVAQEKKVAKVAERVAEAKKPSLKLVRSFRAAARGEEAVIRDIRTDLLAATPDTEPVGRGRDLMAQGLQDVATGLDRIDKALGRVVEGGSVKKARSSIKKAQARIVKGNERIEEGEPLVGAELTPNTPAAES